MQFDFASETEGQTRLQVGFEQASKLYTTFIGSHKTLQAATKRRSKVYLKWLGSCVSMRDTLFLPSCLTAPLIAVSCFEEVNYWAREKVSKTYLLFSNFVYRIRQCVPRFKTETLEYLVGKKIKN